MDKFLCKTDSHKEGFVCSFGPESTKTCKIDPLWRRFMTYIVPLYIVSLCTHCSAVPTVPLFLCTHCSSVPTVPLFLWSHCSSVPAVSLYPLFLCTHCTSVPTVPLYPLFLCSSIPSVPLFLCTHCSPFLETDASSIVQVTDLCKSTDMKRNQLRGKAT